MRLQKYLASSGVASRRKAEEIIAAGRVIVNGQVVSELGVKIDPQNDSILVDGRPVIQAAPVLYLMHKPRGVVTTMSDPQGRSCVGDLLWQLPERVFPVGRLDYDVSGLLLLTNDGDFANELLHPAYEVSRVYWAKVKGELLSSRKLALLEGVQLVDGPGSVDSVRQLKNSPRVEAMLGKAGPGETLLEVVVHEGRKHFVKNVLKAADLPVLSLSRVAFGEFALGDLAEGEIQRI